MFAPATTPAFPIKISDDQWQYLEQIRDQKAPRFVSEKPPSASTSQDQYTLARDSFKRFETVVNGRSRIEAAEDVNKARAILLQLSSYTPLLQDRAIHDKLKAQLQAFVEKAAAETAPKKEEPTRVGLGVIGQDPRFARSAREVTERHGIAGASGMGGVRLAQSQDLTQAKTRGWHSLPNQINPRTEGQILLNALRAIPALADRDRLLREYDAFFKSGFLINTIAKREKLANLLHIISTHAAALARVNTLAYEAFRTLTDPWIGTAPKLEDAKKQLPSAERIEAYGLGLAEETRARAAKIPRDPVKPLTAETLRDIARALLQEDHRNALVGVYVGRVDNSTFMGEFRLISPDAEVVYRKVIEVSGQTFTLILGRPEQATIRATPVSSPYPAAVSIPADRPGDPVAIYGDKEVAALSGKSNTYEAQATNGVSEGVAPITHETLAIALAEYRAHPDPRKARKIITILLTLRQIELVNPAYKEDFLHGLIQAPERLAQLEALIKTHFTGSSGTLITTEELRAISNIARGLPSRPGHQGGKDKESKE